MPASSKRPVPSASTEERFGINAASRLTGVSAHTLRIWERRHGVVEPGRTQTKRRHYSPDDIRRLILVKSLTDLGHKLPHLATLSTDALADRLHQARAGSSFGPLRVAFAGAWAIDPLREVMSDSALRWAGEFADLESLSSNLRPGSADLIVIEIPSLFPESILKIQSALDRQRGCRAVIIYHFAPRAALAALGSQLPGVRTLCAPVSADELRLVLMADAPALASAPALNIAKGTPSGGIPGRRYSDAQLARVAWISSAVKCECPRHLAHLIAVLAAFESYSAQCENRNPDDARLHARLHQATAECRAKMEEALGKVLEMEGITHDLSQPLTSDLTKKPRD